MFLSDMQCQVLEPFVKQAYYAAELKGEDVSLSASYYETQSARSKQEDAVLINPLDSKFANLDDAQIKQAILDAFQEGQTRFGEKWDGSTAIVNILLNNRLYTASLGDSVSFLVTNNNVERLNIELHDKRIISEDHNLVLEVNGSFGDNHFGDKITHIPNIYVDEITAEDVKNDTLQLILACDGLVEEVRLHKEQGKTDADLLKEMIGKHKNYTPEILAKSAFLEHCSKDNISVIQVDLKKLRNNISAIFAVFDGHSVGRYSSCQVSINLAENFNEIICRHLEKALLKNNPNPAIVPSTLYFKQEERTHTDANECNAQLKVTGSY
jgi:serine/threonine protein phosphatase PrpC